MSILAAVADHVEVVVGWDSFVGHEASGFGYADRTNRDKAWRVSGIEEVVILGVVGSVQASQVLRYNFKLPPLQGAGAAGWDLFEWATEAAHQMRIALEARGCGYQEEREGRRWPGSALLVARGRIFEINHDFGVSESRHRYAALGGGCQYAYGSLATTVRRKPLGRVQAALAAAEAHCPWVSKPFGIIRQIL